MARPKPICEPAPSTGREINGIDEDGLEAIAARPFGDAGALLRRGVRTEEENEPLLALVLEKFTEGEAALLTNAVQLGLGMHAGGNAAREREGDEQCERSYFMAPTNFSKGRSCPAAPGLPRGDIAR